MKTIIVSDTHLGPHFNQRKLDFLLKLFSSANKVILNGDFWEASMFSFDQFINSSWSKLFPVLKAKQTVYLYGNHDPKNRADDRINLFSDKQGENYYFNWRRPIYIEHGHRLVSGWERLNFLPNKMILRRLGHNLVGTIEDLGIKLLGSNFSRIFVTRHFENRTLIKKLSEKKIDRAVYVVGHTHRPDYFSGDIEFFNTGCVLFKTADYLEIMIKRLF